MRSAGALMAVTADTVAGYVSNGCVDADIITRAKQGVAGMFIYGEGSPFRDIVLPCGGRIEVAIIPSPDQDIIGKLVSDLDARRSSNFCISSDFQLTPKSDRDTLFETGLTPKLRLRIAGRGEAMVALSRLAETSGLDVVLQSPDAQETPYVPLLDPVNVPPSDDDARTAVVLLFHDHDWEPALLRQALQGPAFYIGAMGSSRTHARRRESLSALGLADDVIDRVRGPVGLLPAMRDANLLAVSILAEIIQVAQSEGLL